jgi:hypothetical protein
MNSNWDRYKDDFKKLKSKGVDLIFSFGAEHLPELFETEIKKKGKDPLVEQKRYGTFSVNYQSWYSEAKALIKQLLPDRLNDFVQHYEKPKNRKGLDYESYRIADALQNLTVTNGLKETIVSPASAQAHIEQQFLILAAVENRFESSLYDIKQLVQADVFDSEIDAARELTKKGFYELRVQSLVSFWRSI